MKNLYRIVRWQCSQYIQSRYSEMSGTFKTLELFGGWLSIDRHFKGSETIAIEWTWDGWCWVNFRKFDAIGRIKQWRYDLTIRTWRHIFTIRRPQADKWRGVTVVNKSTLLPVP